jgi:nucleoside-diphosphate-sugar epimerase
VNPLRVLVTGTSGQIGTNLALRLQREGHEVFGVDIRPNPWTDAFPYVVQDLAAAPPSEAGDVDVVVHLAAHAKVHQLVEQPERALENMTITFNVLEFARKAQVPIVFSSSREVYGDVRRFEGYGEATADFAFTESTYSASKIAGEALIYSYARCYGLRYLVFRFSNVYGRYDSDIERMERVLPLFTRQILHDEQITIYGGEEKTLDFTYVDDCVDGIVRGMHAVVGEDVVNETINLAYGEGNTLVRAAKLIGQAARREPRITLAPSRVGEVTYYVADISKAKELLGWAPETPLERGIPVAVDWWGPQLERAEENVEAPLVRES